MTDEFGLPELLRQAGERMAADLRNRFVSHPGEAGREREQILRSFFESYLPCRFDVASGFAFDSGGHLSRQLDIIIANSDFAPRFETAGGTRHYPCESLVAVGQVKSSLTSRVKLREAFDDLASASSLDRSANGRAFDITYGETLDHRSNYLHQIFTFLFIVGDALAGDTVRAELFDYIESHEPDLWPNVVVALDKFLVTYCCEDGVCAKKMHARGVALQPAPDPPGELMRLYLLLGGAIEVIRVSGLPYWEYLQRVNRWNANVWHHTDDPLPLLSTLGWPRRPTKG